MVKKVVAAAAAASGLVLAGAGLAVADTGKQAPVANVGSEFGADTASGHNPTCVDSSSVNAGGRGPHTHHRDTKDDQQRPGKSNEHPHAPAKPDEHPKPQPPRHAGHPTPHAPADHHQPVPSKDRPFPGELAKTGSSEELRLMMAGSTGLMLGGAILFRRTRSRRR